MLSLVLEGQFNSVGPASIYVWVSGFWVEFSHTTALLSKNNAALPLRASALKRNAPARMLLL